MSSKGVPRQVLRRLVQMVPILLGVSIVVFLLIHLVPGDPAQALLGPQARPEQVQALQTELGLDRPLVAQYGDYVGGLVTGDLGTSLTYDRPLTDLLAERWAPTLWLVGYAALLVILLTIPLAVGEALRPGGAVSGIVRAFSLVGLGMPSFWVGLLLILLFGTTFHIFPVAGYGEGFFGHVRSMFLPALTVALSMAPITIRSLRASLVEMFESDHLVSVRAKGLPEHIVVLRYALRVAVIPVVTVLGVNLGWLIGNTVVIEQIFVIPGLGSLMVDAITNRDFPVVQTLAMVFAVMVVGISLLTDLSRAALDPRVELAWSATALPGAGQAVAANPVVAKDARRRWPRSLVAGTSLLGVLIALAALAPLLTDYGPTDQAIADRLQGPSGAHWLGTDHLGRDVLTRLLYGARIDLRVGLTAVIAPFVIGTTLGLIAGYRRGIVGTIVMRVADVVMAFPYYVLVMALVFAIGPGTKGIYIAVAAVVWSSYARIVYGEVLTASRADYVLAAKAGGLGDRRVMLRHVLPNCITQAIVYSTSDMVVIILGVVTLSFLGLGVPPPTAEWGGMILDARPFIQTEPILMIAPGVAVIITGLAFSLIGDGLARVLRREVDA